MSRCTLYLNVMLLVAPCGCADNESGPGNSASVWYATRPGEKQGPISREQLERRIEQKRLQPDVMVWTAQEERWMPSWELIDPLLELDPPPPDRAGLAFRKLCDRAGRISDREDETLGAFIAAIRMDSSPKVRSILVRHFDLLRDARNGMREVGEIGLDYAQGFELQLPHAGNARSLARLLAADARLRIRENNVSTAADDCAAIARLARQIAADRTVISSTVSMSLAVLFADELRHLLDGGSPDSEAKALILESSDWLRGVDPFNLEAALRVEKVFTVAWAENQLREGKSDEAFQFPPGSDGDEIRRHLVSEVGRSREAFDALIAAVAGRRLPDRKVLDEIEHRILAGEAGIMANMLVLVSPVRHVIDALRRIDPMLDRLASSS